MAFTNLLNQPLHSVP